MKGLFYTQSASLGLSWPPWASLSLSGGPFGAPFSGFGALHKSGFPLCEVLRKLATFWLEATRGLLDAFFRELGPFKKAASQYVSC